MNRFLKLLLILPPPPTIYVSSFPVKFVVPKISFKFSLSTRRENNNFYKISKYLI